MSGESHFLCLRTAVFSLYLQVEERESMSPHVHRSLSLPMKHYPHHEGSTSTPHLNLNSSQRPSDEPSFPYHPSFNNFQLMINFVWFLPLPIPPTHPLHFEANSSLSILSSINISVLIPKNKDAGLLHCRKPTAVL